MPDITKCKGDGCVAKENCYRFTSEDSPYRQSYFMEVPGKDATCEYMMQNRRAKFQYTEKHRELDMEIAEEQRRVRGDED